MRCERCNSSGWVVDYGRVAHFTPSGQFGVVHDVCPDCRGTGILYCCDEAGANPPNTNGESAHPRIEASEASSS